MAKFFTVRQNYCESGREEESLEHVSRDILIETTDCELHINFKGANNNTNRRLISPRD